MLSDLRILILTTCTSKTNFHSFVNEGIKDQEFQEVRKDMAALEKDYEKWEKFLTIWKRRKKEKSTNLLLTF